jgi:hypothetical protein
MNARQNKDTKALNKFRDLVEERKAVAKSKNPPRPKKEEDPVKVAEKAARYEAFLEAKAEKKRRRNA